jgi:hypothetical protein
VKNLAQGGFGSNFFGTGGAFTDMVFQPAAILVGKFVIYQFVKKYM